MRIYIQWFSQISDEFLDAGRSRNNNYLSSRLQSNLLDKWLETQAKTICPMFKNLDFIFARKWQL